MTHRILLLVSMLLAPGVVFANQPVPPDHSTVHIVFIIPNSTPAQFDETTTTVRVGDLIVPIDSVRPISIKIDDEFVGHAMVGYQDVEPVFVLQSGVRKFTFTCDGFKTTSAELKVLGTGSKQYLIVKLTTDSPAKDDESTSGAAKTTVNQSKG